MSDDIKNSYNLEFINIDTNEDLDYLIGRIQNGFPFAEAFLFKSEDLKDNL